MPQSQFFYFANISFNAIHENKILAKISGFTVTAIVARTQLKLSNQLPLFLSWMIANLNPIKL